MSHVLIIPKEHPHSRLLEEVINSLLVIAPAEAVYVSRNGNNEDSPTFITFILTDNCGQNSEGFQRLSEKIQLDYPHFIFRFFEDGEAANKFDEGNIYCIRHCNVNHLIYYQEGHNMFYPAFTKLKKKFRQSKLNYNITVIGQEILDKIKNGGEQVIFVSGHFNNFELMAMQIEKSGINLAAIYRPLNNIFVNIIMERIRKNYICKNQIKKGQSGIRELLSLFHKGHSIALMIDQRLSEGIKSKFFGEEAYTTTMPAQFVKKFDCKIVPIYIERINGINFKIKVFEPIKYDK